jgi:hypothetical protein
MILTEKISGSPAPTLLNAVAIIAPLSLALHNCNYMADKAL